MRALCVVAAGAVTLLSAAPAMAQSGAPDRSTGANAVDAVTQPLSDLNLRSRDIPELLLAAERNPYGTAGMETCEALRDEIEAFEAVLGPDADAEEEGGDLVGSGLKAAGNVLGGFIPFRGVVRQLSGAKAREARWQEAIYAGVARRSFLKGYSAGKECLTRQQQVIQSSQDVLGLGDNR